MTSRGRETDVPESARGGFIFPIPKLLAGNRVLLVEAEPTAVFLLHVDVDLCLSKAAIFCCTRGAKIYSGLI